MDNNVIAGLHDSFSQMIDTRLNHVSSNMSKLSQAILIAAKEDHPTLSEAELKAHPDYRADLMSATSLRTQALASAWVFTTHIKNFNKAKIAPNVYNMNALFSDDIQCKNIQIEALTDSAQTAESIIGNYKLVWPALSAKYSVQLNEIDKQHQQERKDTAEAIRQFTLGRP